MNWINLLRSQQADFIERIKSGCLLHSNKEGQHSEIVVISGDRLKQLRDFCWEMAEKYKRNSPVRQLFINNLKGKLGEEVVKARLAELVTEVDYEKRLGGDGKVDFRLASNQNIGIQVKSRHGSLETVQWSISSEEVEKNSVLICILIQEEVSEAQTQYHLILAGFLPTNMIEVKNGQASVRIEQLLYGGGLVGYLSNLSLFQTDSLLVTMQNIKQEEQQASIKNEENSTSESEMCESIAYSYLSAGTARLRKKMYDCNAIADFDEAIRCNPSESKAYYYRGIAYFYNRYVQNAIEDFTQALRLVPDYIASLYHYRAIAYSMIKDRQRAIEDYTREILINPQDVIAYWFRGQERFHLGDAHRAIEDYTQAIELCPLAHDIYQDRAIAYAAIGNKKAAIEDCDRIIQIEADFISYQLRGDMFSKFGDYKRAIKDYTEGIRLHPTSATLYNKRGSARAEIRDRQGAIADFQKAADLYQQEGKQSSYEEVLEKIRRLQQ